VFASACSRPAGALDHPYVRHLSNSMEGSLLKNGVEIYEYEASMIHTKVMLVDRMWSVVGSTNSIIAPSGSMTKVNIAALDVQLAARLLQDFESDLEQSKRLTYEDWQKRSVITRVLDSLIGLLEQEE